MQCGGDMVWRVAVLSARRSSGAQPFAAVCRFVSSKVWQIIHPLLCCDLSLPTCAVLYCPSLFFFYPSLLCPTPTSPLWVIHCLVLLALKKWVQCDPCSNVQGAVVSAYGFFLIAFFCEPQISCNCVTWMQINVFDNRRLQYVTFCQQFPTYKLWCIQLD